MPLPLIPLIVGGVAAAAGASGAALGVAARNSANDYEGSENSGWNNADRFATGGQSWSVHDMVTGRGPTTSKGATSGYNANAYQYGGRAGAADDAYRGYQDLARQAGDRTGAQADYTMALGDRANAAQARAQQAQALDLQRAAALGQAPSVAQLQMRAGMDAAMRSQEAQRASARGAAGVAMADYGAAANIAASQQQTNQQMGILRAQEMAQARDAYMAGASGMRGMDYQAATQAAQMSQFQTEQEMRQREMNDRFRLGAFGLAEGVRGQQMQGGVANQGHLLQAYLENQRLYQAKEAGDAAAAGAAVQSGVGAASGAANALISAYGK